MGKIKAVIFDMDGVIIDAKEWHYEALNKALGLFGMEISRYDHLVTYDGLPTRQKLEMLTKERALPRSLHSFINELKQKYTMEIIHRECKPTFYHEYALARLKKEGYSLAVCSNSIRNSIQIMLGKARLLDYLDFFLSNQDVVNSKPDPEIYLEAMKKLELQPEECLILEDNINGIQAARRSGAHVLEIVSVEDANYTSIVKKIQEIEKESYAEYPGANCR
jgi:beta-phosphoglucomutase